MAKKRTRKKPGEVIKVRSKGTRRGCGTVVGLMGESGGPKKPRKGYLTYLTKNGSIVEVRRVTKANRKSGWWKKCSIKNRKVKQHGNRLYASWKGRPRNKDGTFK